MQQPSEAEVAEQDAKLAQEEGRLAARLSRLDAIVDGARRFVAGAVEKEKEKLASLSEGGGAKLAKDASELAQFREGGQAIVDKVRKAAEAEARARAEVGDSFSRLAELNGRFESEAGAPLREWRRSRERISGQMKVWKLQRREKDEEGEYATFFAFCEALMAQQAEWDAWAEQIEALETESRLEVVMFEKRLQEVYDARSRAETGIEDIRQIPMSEELVGVEKKKILDSLAKLQTTLNAKLRPGWSRPKQKEAALRSKIEKARELVQVASPEEFMTKSAKLAKFVETCKKEIGQLPVWMPGMDDPGHPHVTAGKWEGKWVPKPGYKARREDDLDPVWTPGMDYPGHPHVSAGEKEGAWEAKPGYKPRRWGDLDPVWAPGMSYPGKPHVHAADTENEWSKDAGWDWVHPETDDLSVRWIPGAQDPYHPHIHASATEGEWAPDVGWTWKNPGITGDLSVRKKKGW